MAHAAAEPEREEIEEKAGRLAGWLAGRGLGGVLLGTRESFAWATAGRSNAVDRSREAGVATLLVTAGGGRYVLANAIEARRMAAEELAGQGWEPVEYPWTEEQSGAPAVARARGLAAGALAADRPVADLPVLDRELARLRYRLTFPEVERFRRLGRDAGEALGEVCRGLEPGLSEREVARRTEAALAARDAPAVVLLVGADERIELYRHPVPTGRRWRRALMVVACARRDGLTVALTRIVHDGPVPAELARRTRAAAGVYAALLARTRPGATGRELFDVAIRAYAAAGFAGEELRHHQGGACGYASRDWIAHPASDEVVVSPQAFAWNPSVTGTKVEETCLCRDGGIETLTATPGWPMLEAEADGRVFPSPDVARLPL